MCVQVLQHPREASAATRQESWPLTHTARKGSRCTVYCHAGHAAMHPSMLLEAPRVATAKQTLRQCLPGLSFFNISVSFEAKTRNSNAKHAPLVDLCTKRLQRVLFEDALLSKSSQASRRFLGPSATRFGMHACDFSAHSLSPSRPSIECGRRLCCWHAQPRSSLHLPWAFSSSLFTDRHCYPASDLLRSCHKDLPTRRRSSKHRTEISQTLL